MKSPRWFASPLAGTAAVLAGLCLLAVPLRKLTSAHPTPVVETRKPEVSPDSVSGVLRLKLLAPAKQLTLKTPDGVALIDLQNPAAGETEHDGAIPLREGKLELVMEVEFGDTAPETAAFLTVMPDGYREQTRYAIGSGRLVEILNFDWNLR